ncbi:hypothetical protein GTW09_06660 [Alteromonas hispanica]|uniref:SUMF1/EgtB/PvdO family nonheme iron enzyme n=1 Tax=Alteromonas hispanica TaxID=315421 RepID=A0A6L9MTF5_9ALTE|nr:hypothetical protein [Alteromonas hispanica]
MRGGSWNNKPRNMRASNRNRNNIDKRRNNNGFRLAQSARHCGSNGQCLCIYGYTKCIKGCPWCLSCLRNGWEWQIVQTGMFFLLRRLKGTI